MKNKQIFIIVKATVIGNTTDVNFEYLQQWSREKITFVEDIRSAHMFDVKKEAHRQKRKFLGSFDELNIMTVNQYKEAGLEPKFIAPVTAETKKEEAPKKEEVKKDAPKTKADPKKKAEVKKPASIKADPKKVADQKKSLDKLAKSNSKEKSSNGKSPATKSADKSAKK
jgi:hypothetical protein